MSSLGMDVVKIRLVKERAPSSYRSVDSPERAIEIIKKELSSFDREVVCVVNVRADLTPINMNIVSMGSVNASICSPREVFKSSILSNAAAFFLFHNHPSGRCVPSQDDRDITKRLEAAGQLLDIELLDHIIVSSGPEPGYYSFKDHGDLTFKEPGGAFLREEEPER